LFRNVVEINDSVSTPEKSLYGSVLVVDVFAFKLFEIVDSLFRTTSVSSLDDDDEAATSVDSVVTV